MPKVDDTYFEEKRNQILDSTYRVCIKKPLNVITMKDVIDEAKLSRGGIYRYYSNFYDVLFALIERETHDIHLRERVDEIFERSTSPEMITAKIIEVVLEDHGDIEKILFELTLIFARAPELYKRFYDKTTIEQDEGYLMEKSAAYISAKAEEGYFKPIAPVQDLLSMLVASIDGIKRDVILTKYYEDENTQIPFSFDLRTLTLVLSKSFILALGGNLKNLERKGPETRD
jgi:AcrR family transcriptional regulator